ncbi:hypothetical protein CTAYLR_001937 [Chrysophaeum taylorii]|uniref:ABC1 atypical kinase-like domain-containing protein n=1 Tax=Chrysophaeum taylorii TaxID=2483200 RepID=A0AAD7U8I1_9STRA|nr:hypothetical protein CTAYLR_001937 [Chrysophaeum taylorii]
MSTTVSHLKSLNGTPVREALTPVVVEVGEENVRVSTVDGVLVVGEASVREEGARLSFADDDTAEGLARGRLTPQRALASGAMRVHGDPMALRAVGPLLASAVASFRIVAERARGKERYYAVQCPPHPPKERRFEEFVALRRRLRIGPSLSGFAVCGDRRALVDLWLKELSGRPAARAALREFAGVPKEDDDDPRREELIKELRRRVKEPEELACRVAAAATYATSRFVAVAIAIVGFAGGGYLCGFVLPRPVGVPLWVAALVFFFSERLLAHLTRLCCAVVCAAAWRCAKLTEPSAEKKDDEKKLVALADGARPLAERLALRLAGEVVARVAVAEKGLLVKLAQFVASMSGLLSPELTEPLVGLTDAMPQMSRRDLKKRLDFALFQKLEAPVAAASIAQVHRVCRDDGVWTAVKVQKPGLRRRFSVELRSARAIAALAVRLEPTAPDIRATLDDAYDLHIKELDFAAEAVALRAARRVVTARALDCVVPEPLEEYDGVLVMRWCDGSKIADVSLSAVTLADGTRLAIPQVAGLASKLVDSFAALFLVGGLVNLDPHAGNVLVQMTAAGPRPVLLDWGMHEILRRDVRLGFAKILVATADGDARAIGEALSSLGVKSTFSSDDSLLHLRFLLRASNHDARLDRAEIEAFARAYENQVEIAKTEAKTSNQRIVDGAEVFNSLVRQLDLLHGYVAALPCRVDFLSAYAKWGRIALEEASC